MTIFALCCFSAGLDPDPDAVAEALRAAGYQVFRLPRALKKRLEVTGDDFIEVRGKGNDDDGAARDAMEADVNRILSPFGGEIDSTGALTIAEMWTPSPSLPYCARCIGPGTPDRPLLSTAAKRRVLLLHNDCREAWLAEPAIPF